ncbi:MAG: crossover junction endodeoxyribonuclease RuvC [Candidatus Nanopelagicales bacterium]
MTPDFAIGIDPGISGRAGAAIIFPHEPKPNAVAWALVPMDSTHSLVDRSDDMARQMLAAVVEQLDSRPDVNPMGGIVTVEHPVVGQGRKSSIVQAMTAGWIAAAFAAVFGARRVRYVSPARAKKAATGNGNAGKETVASMMAATYGIALEGTQADRWAKGDALAIATAGMHDAEGDQ